MPFRTPHALPAIYGLLVSLLLQAAPDKLSAQEEVPIHETVQPPACQDSGPARVEFTLSPAGDRLKGVFQYPLPCGQPLLILHANAFREPPEALTDVRYRWIYPGRFSPGGLRMTQLWLEPHASPGALPQTQGPLAMSLDIPPHSTDARRVTVRLPPHSEGMLTGTFETQLPQRFGTFGRYRGQITLEAGFFPLLTKTQTPHEDGPILLPERVFSLRQHVQSGTHDWQQTARAPHFIQRTQSGEQRLLRQERQPDVRITWMPWAGAHRMARLQRTVSEALELWQRLHPELDLSGADPVLLEQVPLRDELTWPVDGAVFFSDRLYRVSRLFAAFQDAELRFRVLEQLYRRVLERSPERTPEEVSWLAELLAWRALRDSALPDKASSGNNPQPAPSIEQLLGHFTVIPIIDRLLHNPNYPMGHTYAGTLIQPDLFQQHLSSSLGGQTSGRLLAQRLEARLGPQKLDALLHASIQPNAPSFQVLLAERAPDVAPFLARWCLPPREGNYSVEQIQAVKSGDNAAGMAVALTVAHAAHPPLEPLTLEIKTRPALEWPKGGLPRQHSERYRGTLWVDDAGLHPKQLQLHRIDAAGADSTHNSASSAGAAAPTLTWLESSEPDRPGLDPDAQARIERTLRLELDHPFEGLILDPDQVLLESSRADNQWPVAWNWLLWDFLVSNNASLDGRDGFLSFLINLHYKDTLLSRRILELEGWSQEESFGAAFGYLRYFGQKRTVYRWEHELSARLEYRNLNQAFELAQTEGGTTLQALDSALTLKAGYSFENRLNPYTPIHGSALDVKGMVGVGLPESGGVTGSFGAVSLHARTLLPFSAVHGLAARIKLETYLWGDTIPEMNAFLLGGEEDLRSLSPRALGGLSKLLFSVEDRHPLLLDLDINLILFRVREARGVAFLDAGFVAEQGFQGLTGDKWHAAVGYGLRFNIDLFGLSPLLFAVNLALPLDTLIVEQRWPVLEDFRRMESSYHAF